MNGISERISNGLQISIDWLAFTIKDIKHVDGVVDFLGYNIHQFSHRKCGGNGYRSSMQLKGLDLVIYHDGADDMGIHVIIKGSAISNFFSAFRETFSIDTPFGAGYDLDINTTVLVEFLRRVRGVGQFTRIDVAVDDIGTRYYSTMDLLSIMQGNLYSSKFRKWTNYQEFDTQGVLIGHTVYLGTRQSDIFLRVYDKQLERNSRLQNTDSPLINYKWTRWELELKGDRANQFVNQLINGLAVSDVTIGALSHYLRIIKLDNERKSRCSTDDVWTDFLNGIRGLRLAVSLPPKTLEQKKNWLKRSVAPTMYAVSEIEGSIDFLHDCLEWGSLKQNSALRDMIRQATYQDLE